MGNNNSAQLEAAQRRIGELERLITHPLNGYSLGNQEERFRRAKAENNQRYLNIEAYFQPKDLHGKRVLVTGSNRGLGFHLTLRLILSGAKVYAASRSKFSENALQKINNAIAESKRTEEETIKYIDGIDVQDDASLEKLVGQVDEPLDIVINNAGYFYGPRERFTEKTLSFDEELKQIDICALGPLRVSYALFHKGLIKKMTGKIAIITSQAGSIAWRDFQNPEGDNYGHHMSRSACNMMGRLLSFELKDQISVTLLHPGFNRTKMTEKLKDVWEKEGAVDPSIGAMRVLHEVNNMTLFNSGQYINCEDGLLIPW